MTDVTPGAQEPFSLEALSQTMAQLRELPPPLLRVEVPDAATFAKLFKAGNPPTPDLGTALAGVPTYSSIPIVEVPWLPPGEAHLVYEGDRRDVLTTRMALPPMPEPMLEIRPLEMLEPRWTPYRPGSHFYVAADYGYEPRRKKLSRRQQKRVAVKAALLKRRERRHVMHLKAGERLLARLARGYA